MLARSATIFKWTLYTLAGLVWAGLWWLHAITDIALVGYLVYLRRQVRIEEDVRSRRLARLSAPREQGDYDEAEDYDDYEETADADEVYDEPESRRAGTRTPMR